MLNAEQDSAAAEHFQLHGPSVCAMAIRVDDAARAQARARALLCPEWQEPIGTGERRIPAVRAPDGTLLYLVQPEAGGRSFWEDDFDLLPEADASRLTGWNRSCGAGLAGRAHGDLRAVLACPVRAGAATATGYAGSVWPGAQPRAGQRERQGPPGAECVGRPRNADRTVRLGLRRCRRAPRGSRHIGYHSHGPGFGNSPHAPAAHAESITTTTLSARWALDDPTLHELQEHGLLYDRDDNGEFRHLYTECLP